MAVKGIKKLLALALTGAVLMTSITECAFGNGKQVRL